MALITLISVTNYSCAGPVETPAIGFLFVHGIADTHKQAYNYTKFDAAGNPNKQYIIDGPLKTFDFPDAQGWFAKKCRVDWRETSMGQDNELDALRKAYNEFLDENPHLDGVVIIALSRGTMAAIHFAALDKPAKLQGMILESPLPSFRVILESLLEKTRLPDQVTTGLARLLVHMRLPFRKHHSSGIHPINMVAQVPSTLPIMIFACLEDRTVPSLSSEHVYKKFITTGHLNTHFSLFGQGQHSKILQGKDGQIMQADAHAFLKKYNLPHNPLFAEQSMHPDFRAP